MKNKFVQIQTTVANKKDAEKIAKVLSQRKLSACTQIIGPVTSIYRWKGKLENSKEFLILIKTKLNLYKKVEKVIKENHPYELPEIIVTPIIAGSKEYLNWLNKEIK
ncbi:MAG: divalent-cation tolerance protein CutA [Patescibacteria group bacterium]